MEKAIYCSLNVIGLPFGLTQDWACTWASGLTQNTLQGHSLAYYKLSTGMLFVWQNSRVGSGYLPWLATNFCSQWEVRMMSVCKRLMKNYHHQAQRFSWIEWGFTGVFEYEFCKFHLAPCSWAYYSMNINLAYSYDNILSTLKAWFQKSKVKRIP